MKGFYPGCDQVVDEVQPNDVAQVNRQNNPATRPACTSQTTPSNASSMVCEDNDADGVTACDGDCDDFDASRSYDCYYYDPSPQGGCYYRYQCSDYYECRYNEESGSYYDCRYIGSGCYSAGMYCYQ